MRSIPQASACPLRGRHRASASKRFPGAAHWFTRLTRTKCLQSLLGQARSGLERRARGRARAQPACGPRDGRSLGTGGGTLPRTTLRLANAGSRGLSLRNYRAVPTTQPYIELTLPRRGALRDTHRGKIPTRCCRPSHAARSATSQHRTRCTQPSIGRSGWLHRRLRLHRGLRPLT